jgi:hypothetical protein
MKSQFAFLCDAVNITGNNLFNVLGGGVENIFSRTLPFTRHMSLLVRIEYSHVESGGHTVQVRLIDGDGKDRMAPASLQVDFPESSHCFNLMATLSPTFERYGAHSVEIAVDRNSLASIPINAQEIKRQ